MKNYISLDTVEKVKLMLQDHSISEIANETGISRRTVCNIIRQWNITRSSEQLSIIRSRIRKKLVQDERRRVIFGQEQVSNIKVVNNKDKHSLKYRLKRVGYFNVEDKNTFYYNLQTKRNPSYEKKCEKLGIKIKQAI